MGDAPIRRSRAGLRAAALLIAIAPIACGRTTPSFDASARPSEAVATVATSADLSTAPIPSSPTDFDVRRVPGTFPAVTALTSTGEQLYWASEASIWRYAPGDTRAERIYESPARGGLVWDVAAAGDGVIASEQLPEPNGTWRVLYLAADGASPVEVDAGVAARGAPPTVAIDARRIAWAGFDETSGAPRSFVRVADRRDPAVPRTVLEGAIDDRLLWYPQLDADTLWFATIDPDFEGTGAGDAFHIETLPLTTEGSAPERFEGLENVFEPAVTADHVAWKSVDPGFSALTWGEIDVLDRRMGERYVVAARANHATVGSRFVTFEEFFHERLLIYDLATRRTIEISDPLHGAKGTVGVPAIAGDLLGYSVSVRGDKTVSWVRLPG